MLVAVVLDIALPNARDFSGRCLTLFSMEIGSTKVYVKRAGQRQTVDLISQFSRKPNEVERSTVSTVP